MYKSKNIFLSPTFTIKQKSPILCKSNHVSDKVSFLTPFYFKDKEDNFTKFDFSSHLLFSTPYRNAVSTLKCNQGFITAIQPNFMSFSFKPMQHFSTATNESPIEARIAFIQSMVPMDLKFYKNQLAGLQMKDIDSYEIESTILSFNALQDGRFPDKKPFKILIIEERKLKLVTCLEICEQTKKNKKKNRIAFTGLSGVGKSYFLAHLILFLRRYHQKEYRVLYLNNPEEFFKDYQTYLFREIVQMCFEDLEELCETFDFIELFEEMQLNPSRITTYLYQLQKFYDKKNIKLVLVYDQYNVAQRLKVVHDYLIKTIEAYNEIVGSQSFFVAFFSASNNNETFLNINPKDKIDFNYSLEKNDAFSLIKMHQNFPNFQNENQKDEFCNKVLEITGNNALEIVSFMECEGKTEELIKKESKHLENRFQEMRNSHEKFCSKFTGPQNSFRDFLFNIKIMGTGIATIYRGNKDIDQQIMAITKENCVVCSSKIAEIFLKERYYNDLKINSFLYLIRKHEEIYKAKDPKMRDVKGRQFEQFLLTIFESFARKKIKFYMTFFKKTNNQIQRTKEILELDRVIFFHDNMTAFKIDPKENVLAIPIAYDFPYIDFFMITRVQQSESQKQQDQIKKMYFINFSLGQLHDDKFKDLKEFLENKSKINNSLHLIS